MAIQRATTEPKAAGRLADFDEQLWPVNALLLVLAAGAAALTVARADFHTRDPWHNGYVHLAALVGLVLLLGIAAALLNHAHQRRMQLALLASLLVHLWLSVGMREYRLPQIPGPIPRAGISNRQPVHVPDYDFQKPEVAKERQFFEQPLNAEPDAAVSEMAPQRVKPAANLLAKNQPVLEELPEAEPVEMNRAAESAPHRGERLTIPEKAARDELATLEPAPAALEKRAARNQQNNAAEAADPTIPSAGQRSRVLPPRVTQSPAASRSLELEAAPAALPRGDPTAAENADAPAADRLARSATNAALPESAVPIATSPAAGSGTAATEIDTTPGVVGRTSRPGATDIPESTSLPEAEPGFAGPTIPIAPRMAGRSPEPDTERSQVALGGISRSQRDDVPLADTAILTRPGRVPSNAAAGAPGSAGLEPSATPRRRGGPSLSLRAGGQQAGAEIDAEPSLGHAPGAPAIRTAEGQPPRGPGGLAGSPSSGVGTLLRKSGTAAAIDSSGPVALPSGPLASARVASSEPPGVAGEAPSGRIARPSGVPLGNRAPLPTDRNVQPAIEPGLPSPRARPESDVLAANASRMILERSGSELPIDSRVRDTAVPGYKQRDRAGRSGIAQQRGGSVETEKAVEDGLRFLARFQADNGSWNLHNSAPGFDYPAGEIPQLNSTTAATGLALLAFLGAGYTHTDGPYRSLVQRGLNHLLIHQQPGGDLFEPQDRISNSSAWLYSHGIASIALCEAYGMTRDRRLREPAQRALDFIAAAQSPEDGGWRYAPRRGTDTSVSGWQLMALKSGELAGLKVPRDCYSRVASWLDSAAGAGGDDSRYAYLPGSEHAAYRAASTVMTAEALLMRQYLGWKHDHPEMIAGANWLAENLPEFGSPTAAQPTGSRNAYYWYYGTQVMFQMRGSYWTRWNSQLRPLLIKSQVADGPLAGSWDPVQPVPDRYGYMVGRLYVTALHLLVLEVYYRHLPIYQTLEQHPAK